MTLEGAHGVSATVHTHTQYLQDGSSWVENQIDPREIRIGSKITGKTGAHIIEARLALLSAMSPKAGGWLTLRRGKFSRRIRCQVEQAPAFPAKNGVDFKVNLYCPSPYWEAAEQVETPVSAWEPRFKWPHKSPIETGFIFGIRTEVSTATVINGGDVDIGMIITFKAIGESSGAKILDVDTGKYLRVAQDMVYGEKVEISTTRGNLYVRHYDADGNWVNAFRKLDPASKFLQLKCGPNRLQFSADRGATSMDATISYRESFLGV